jgi:hypothetical protein
MAQDVARTCKECGQAYSVDESAETDAGCFPWPWSYDEGCEEYCLACWLGVGPNDAPRA